MVPKDQLPNSRTFCLQELPMDVEVYLSIFKLLNGKELGGKVSIVCKLWHELAKDDALWREMAQSQWPGCQREEFNWKKFYIANFNLITKGAMALRTVRLGVDVYAASDRTIAISKQIPLMSFKKSLKNFSTYNKTMLNTGHKLPITSLMIQNLSNIKTRDDIQIITASSDHTVKIFKEITDRDGSISLFCQTTLTHHTGYVTALLVAKQWIISASRDGTIGVSKTSLINHNTQFIGSLIGHHSAVTHLLPASCRSPDKGIKFYSGAADGSIRLWQVLNDNTFECLQIVESKAKCLKNLTSLSLCRYLYATREDDQIEIWKKDKHKKLFFKGFSKEDICVDDSKIFGVLSVGNRVISKRYFFPR